MVKRTLLLSLAVIFINIWTGQHSINTLFFGLAWFCIAIPILVIGEVLWLSKTKDVKRIAISLSKDTSFSIALAISVISVHIGFALLIQRIDIYPLMKFRQVMSAATIMSHTLLIFILVYSLGIIGNERKSIKTIIVCWFSVLSAYAIVIGISAPNLFTYTNGNVATSGPDCQLTTVALNTFRICEQLERSSMNHFYQVLVKPALYVKKSSPDEGFPDISVNYRDILPFRSYIQIGDCNRSTCRDYREFSLMEYGLILPISDYGQFHAVNGDVIYVFNVMIAGVYGIIFLNISRGEYSIVNTRKQASYYLEEDSNGFKQR
jgi:hypothetical protein